MPGSRLYNFSLAQPQFEVTPFQAVAFEPKEQANFALLANAFDKIEQRENQYNTSIANMDKSFAALQPSLSQDKQTLDWFENYKKKYRDVLTDFATSGDYHNAAAFGTKLASEMLNDGELIGHIHAYETYKKEYDKVKQKAEASGDVIGLHYFEEQNKYSPNNIQWLTDSTGKITGASEYNVKTPYFETIDYAKEIWAKGFQLINVDQSSKSSRRSVGSSYTDDFGGTTSHSGSSHSTSLSKVTPQEILKSWDAVVKATGISPSRIKYDYESRLSWRNKLKAEYDAMSESDKLSTKGQDLNYEIKLYDSVLYHNGIADYRSFYADMIAGGETAKAVADLMAYKHTSVSDDFESNSGKTIHDPKKMAELDQQGRNIANGVPQDTPEDSAIQGDTSSGNNIFMDTKTSIKQAAGRAAAASLTR